MADLAALADELADLGLRPAVAWSTHPHWDHVLWSAGLGDAPRYAAPAAVPSETEREAMLEQLGSPRPVMTWSWSGGCRPWTGRSSRGTGRRRG